ncbi:MAG TPA: hypothetical protein VGM82_20830 [Gemmatimonadaceae bacterium]|jgi:hypothetical protein
MMREWIKTPAMRVAVVVLGASVIVFLWTLVRALHAQPIPTAAPTTLVGLDAVKRGPSRQVAEIQTGVEHDLFSPDRSAPDTPYRMPGENNPNDKPRVEAQKPIVLGTAVVSDGHNFATLQLGMDSPKLVRVGDKIGEWTVRSIARGKVVLEGTEGNRAELGVPNPPGR